nr:receptor type tyrosine protein phosphatase [Hymenolepis microstoma]
MNSTSSLSLRRFDKKLSWCVLRQRRDPLKSDRSSSYSRRRKGSIAEINNACYDLGDKSSPSTDLDHDDGRALDSGALGFHDGTEESSFDPMSCCCCCTLNATSTPGIGKTSTDEGNDPITTSANSLPYTEESCLRTTSELVISTTTNNVQIQKAASPSPVTSAQDRVHLNLALAPTASASLPASPAIPPIETHIFQVQPPVNPRPCVTLGQQRANLMESSCSAGDIQAANRKNDSPTASMGGGCFAEEPPKAKNRSLLELRRGPRAALVLDLHSGASSSPSPLINTFLHGAVRKENNRLLTADNQHTTYATFKHDRPSQERESMGGLGVASSGTCALTAVAGAAVEVATAVNLSPRPMTGEEPSRIVDRVTLRTASLPLTPEALEAKLGPGGEDRLYKEFWDIPMNYANKADCPWVGVGQKNRYHEVLPHNNTRVILPAINNDDMTSYINANYIHGYQGRPRAFIATQGPMSHTINDFWRMVWHYRAPAIVMLTKICEQDKRSKCELYLPTSKNETCDRTINTPIRADTVPVREQGIPEGPPCFISEAHPRSGGAVLHTATSLPTPPTPAFWGEEFSRTCSPVGAQRTFGNIHVRVIAVTQKESYTERKLVLKMDGEERKVTHFWYTGWSDHSSPEATLESARSLLDLVNETEACRHQNNGSSLPSTPAPLFIRNAPLPPNSPRSLSRQTAEEWSDADFDLRFHSPLPEEESPPTTAAFDLFTTGDSEPTSGGLCLVGTPSYRAYRASDPAPMSASGSTGPVVVHCSAGVGRTGCFIALCIGCEQLRTEEKVDVLGIVSRLRLDRGGMVENSEQYTFLHAALCMYNAVRSGREMPVLPAITNLRNQFTGPLR